MQQQQLTLTLDGITAGDYMTWVRDSEPPALGRELDSISVRGDALGDTLEASLSWNVAPPDATAAAATAGLPLTPEVVAVKAHPDDTRRGKRRQRRAAPSPLARLGEPRGYRAGRFAEGAVA